MVDNLGLDLRDDPWTTLPEGIGGPESLPGDGMIENNWVVGHQPGPGRGALKTFQRRLAVDLISGPRRVVRRFGRRYVSG